MAAKIDDPKLDEFEKKLTALNVEALAYVQAEIKRDCDENGYTFKSLNDTQLIGPDGEPLSYEDEDASRTFRLWRWYEQAGFGVFPDMIYENGKWVGQE